MLGGLVMTNEALDSSRIRVKAPLRSAYTCSSGPQARFIGSFKEFQWTHPSGCRLHRWKNIKGPSFAGL
jgi:hypothetical protein